MKRPLRPKFKKVKNRYLIDQYIWVNSYCEPCRHIDNVTNIFNLSCHHILGGDKRTDELWNLMIVCIPHHNYATTHNLEYGSKSKEWNDLYFAIKLMKHEVTEEQLIKLKRFAPVYNIYNERELYRYSFQSSLSKQYNGVI